MLNLEPKEVFQYFLEICKIPHGSGNVDLISDYLKKFAEDRKLFVIQDDLKNIIMIKEATDGYEKEEPVILQGHMDMVAVKVPECPIDMEKEGLLVDTDGTDLYAIGTSLGGDDGIAVAYILALLDSNVIHHPRIEAVITVDEETGMDGAIGIDLTKIKGKRMINLDSEEEGHVLTGCAGGATLSCTLPIKRFKKKGIVGKLFLEGLTGGHSGEEIDKGRANAVHLMTDILLELLEVYPFELIDLSGGIKDNAIPDMAEATILIDHTILERFLDKVSKMNDSLMQKYCQTDPELLFYMKRLQDDDVQSECKAFYPMVGEERNAILRMIHEQPDGMQEMSKQIPGLVETSLNLGVAYCKENRFVSRFHIRSSVSQKKKELIDRVTSKAVEFGGEVVNEGEYPAWEYRSVSPLRDKLCNIYKKMYGTNMVVKTIHAGLECGILAEKFADLDCVSIGPDMKDIHTPRERLNIASVRRVWEFLLAVLAEK